MINFPSKQSEINKVEVNYLEKLVMLRKKAVELEYLIKETMDLAINEAIDILNDGKAVNGKNVVFSQKGKGKVTVTFRKSYPSIKDNVSLQRLSDDIKAEKLVLAKKNEVEIDKIETEVQSLNELIEKLETQQENLLSNKRLINLKTRFNNVRDEGVELLPSLNVFVD